MSSLSRIVFKSHPYYSSLCKDDEAFRKWYPSAWLVSVLIITYQIYLYIHNGDLFAEDIEFVQFGFKNLFVCLVITIPWNNIILTIFYVRAKHWFENEEDVWSPFLALQFPLIVAIHVLSVTAIINWIDVGVVTKFAIHVENLRITMKMIAVLVYVYPSKIELSDDAPRSRSRIKNAIDEYPTPDEFRYFIFAPTTIFRKSYPRNATINWFNVLFNFVQLLMSIDLLFLLFKYGYASWYQNFGIQEVTLIWTSKCLIHGLVCGIIFLFVFHSALFHSYFNMTGELTRFADRSFHGNWWLQTTATSFSRSWDTIISNFIKECLNDPMYQYCGNSASARWFAFTLSGLFHDPIFAWPFGFSAYFICWGPLFLVWPLCSAYLDPVVKRRGKEFPFIFKFRVLFIISIAYAVTIHVIEYYSLKNCPQGEKTLLKSIGLKPHFLSCY